MRKKVIRCGWIFVLMIILLPVLGGRGGASTECETVDVHRKQEASRPQKKPEDRMFYFDRQVVPVDDFVAEGFILDIGGGGEGVIGQLKGRQVVAVDISQRELADAPPGPLKIVMDARDLKFLDDVFHTVTVFFTFMYIDEGDHEKVFSELERVMAPGGRLLIWDVILPERKDDAKDIAVYPFQFKLPQKEISTGYGVKWPQAGRDPAYYLKPAERYGFRVVSQKTEGLWFFMELQKP